MGDGEWACPNVACRGGGYEVEERVPGACWRLSRAGLAWLVAADRPVCPWCGGVLRAPPFQAEPPAARVLGGRHA